MQAQFRPARAVLTLIAAVFYAAGWLAWHVAAAVWAVCSWSAAAVVVGWAAAKTPRSSPGGS
jgi:hypothetical protein